MSVSGVIKFADCDLSTSGLMTDKQKEIQRLEGARLKAIIDAAKRAQKGLNQAKLAKMLGLKNQSQVSHWCTGFVRIPDDALITLAELLDFDPKRVRPEITEYIERAQSVLGGDKAELSDLIDRLYDQEAADVERYVRFVLQSRGEK